MSWRIESGDCIERMAAMADASIDAIVTDPPYGIGFMGHEWDQPGEFGPVSANGDPAPMQSGKRRRRQPSAASGAGHASERKPLNGHGKREGAKFGGPTGKDNTKHTARGGAMHAGRYDLSLTANQRYQAWCEAWAREAFRILKPGGHLLASCGTRTYHRLAAGIEDVGFEIRDSIMWIYGSGFPKSRNLDGEWEGWGTALKPAHEPIVVARKPFAGTVAANVLEHGTGGLNIDGCRIDFASEADEREAKEKNRHADFGEDLRDRGEGGNYDAVGRWPANVILDEEAAAELDAQSGESISRQGQPRSGVNGAGWGMTATGAEYDDRGGASRFFYCAKTSRAERNAGLTGEAKFTATMGDGIGAREHNPGEEGAWQRNHHPTVKPISLMRWLCRLVTPPGGTVLDPFLGSGSTGCAAVLEGFDFIGIEREADYLAIAEARIEWWSAHRGREADEVLEQSRRSEQLRAAHEDAGQLGLLG